MKNAKIAAGYGIQLTNVYPELQAWRINNNNSTIVLDAVLKSVRLNNTESAGRSVANSLKNAFLYYKANGNNEPTNKELIDYIVGDFNW